MPSVVLCNSIDCMFNDDGQCDVDKLAIVDGVCAGSLRCGRNVTGNDLDERLKEENAKLRDLVDLMLSCPMDKGDCDKCRQLNDMCEVEVLAGELGIEVE